MLQSLPSDEEINYKRHMAGIVDKSDWVQLSLMDCMSMMDNDVISILSKVRSCSSSCHRSAELQAEANLPDVRAEGLPVRGMRRPNCAAPRRPA